MARNVCSVEACEEFVVGGGLCEQHYRQKRRRERKPQQQVGRMGRRCRHCNDLIPLDRNMKAIYCSYDCKVKASNKREAGRPEHAERLRRYHYKSKYGITTEQFDALHLAQGGHCAVCRGEPNGRGRLHVDHCHETGAVRGLLCTDCNTGLGKFRDDPELLEAAARYLRTA